MYCPGFPSDHYDLFALGVLEDAEAAGIREHVRRGCGTCVEAVQASLARVGELALIVPPAEPSRGFRKRVMATVKPAKTGWRAWVGSPSFGAAMAVAGLSIGLGCAWLGGVFRPPAALVAELKMAPVVVAPATPDAPPAAEVPRKPGGNTAAEAALPETLSQRLTQSLNQSRQQTAEAVRAAAKLEGDLRADLRAKDQELAAAEARYTAAVQAAQMQAAQARKDGESAEGVRKQLAAAQARVQELGTQVAFYQAALQRQSADAGADVQLISLLIAPTLRMVELRATEQGGGSSGRAFFAQRGVGMFLATGLPALAAGRSYQLWLLRAQAPGIVSGGVFRPGQGMAGQGGAGQRNGVLIEIADGRMLVGLTAMSVTEEPLGGSPLPTGHKILLGLARG